MSAAWLARGVSIVWQRMGTCRPAVILAAIAGVLLAASASVSAAEATAPGRIATFRCDVTPPIGHWLYRRPLETIEHRLEARGVVIEDSGKRYVLCAVDWCTLSGGTYDMFRRKMAEAAGTDVSRVALHCVHQHTSMSINGDAQRLLGKQEDSPKQVDLKFLDEVGDRLGVAVKGSLDRLETFDRIGIGKAKVDRVASARRILTPEGTIRTRWSSCKDADLRAEPEGRIDPVLMTITFARGDEPLVRLHYYATHPQSFYGDGRASYDVPGIARTRLQEKDGAFQIYFTGCAGDVVMGKYNDGTREARKELAGRLYEGMEAAVAATRYMPAGPITWRTVDVTLSGRITEEDLAASRKTFEDSEADFAERMRAARRVCSAERLARPIQLVCIRMGPVAIVHLPGEPMIEFQLFAQQVAPDAFVAVAGYGDGTTGYICTEKAFEEGGYEPSASNVAPESEKRLKNAIRKLLKAK